MSDISDPLPQDFSNPGQTKADHLAAFAEEQEWQVAQQRALLYLRSLPLTAEKTLELALESLRRAKSAPTSASETTAAGLTMRALRVLMKEQGIEPLGLGLTQGAKNPTGGSEISSMPALKRESMVPEIIDRQPWFSFIFSGFRKGREGRGTG